MTAPRIRYPKIHVRLVGTDGNAFAILGRVTNALREACVPGEEREEFLTQATAGDYDHLLATCSRWVTVL